MSSLAHAIALHQKGQLDAAAAAYEAVLAKTPREADALLNYGTLKATRGDVAGAETLFKALLSAHPKTAYGHYAYANLLLSAGRAEEAVTHYRKAIALAPNMAEFHHNLAVALSGLKREDEALTAYDAALAANPAFVASALNKGIVLQKRGANEASLACYNAVLARAPNHAEALTNRAMVLNLLEQFEDALADCDAALAHAPNIALTHNNRGNALTGLGRMEEALAAYTRAHALDANYVDPYWNLAMTHLALGDFAKGLPYYEWRWKTEAQKHLVQNFSVPLWLGDAPIAGKLLCLYHEQGFGDYLQMARYIPLLLAKGAHLVVCIHAALERLFRASFTHPNLTFVVGSAALPPIDYHCPIMSLPLAFATRLETIPSDIPYLTVPEEAQAKWRARLGTKAKLRVGLVASGAAAHTNDRNRSIALSRLAPLFALPVEFHSLQKEFRAEDKPFLSALTTHAEAIEDFADTAALIQEMDLVITVDTSVAHLAGALGVPVWVMLPRTAVDYRWLLEREDSPWYPSARLFRHHHRNETWNDVIARVAAALVDVATRSVVPPPILGGGHSLTQPHQNNVPLPTSPLQGEELHTPSPALKAATLAAEGRYAEALPHYEAILTANPEDADATRDLGIALERLGLYRDAVEWYDRYRTLRPADAVLTTFSMAQLLLLTGDYANGWKLYESRWQLAPFQPAIRGFTQPLWLGEAPIAGKTLLIHPEQGFGDYLQMVRYVPTLVAMGARVILEAKAPMLPLMRSLSPAVTLVEHGAPLPAFDYHCPIMSLPRAMKTTLETIPATVPYLAPGEEALARWRAQLGEKTRPRIGLVWSGSATHGKDSERSIPLADLAALTALPYAFHALQKDIRAADEAHLGAVTTHREALATFDDAAALTTLMDLVITVDTSAAHLAGALGVPVWVLLPHVPDYRWMLARDDNPWYPTARLFRQTKRDDWSNVIGSVIEALAL